MRDGLARLRREERARPRDFARGLFNFVSSFFSLTICFRIVFFFAVRAFRCCFVQSHGSQVHVPRVFVVRFLRLRPPPLMSLTGQLLNEP